MTILAATVRTEKDVARIFDKKVEGTGLFEIHPEVHGTLEYAAPLQKNPDFLRIDRILLPTEKLIKLGWPHGALGVDLKGKGEKLGRAAAQAQDYRRTTWKVPGYPKLTLDWCFLFPFPTITGCLGSFMAQTRIGTGNIHKEYRRLLFTSSDMVILNTLFDGTNVRWNSQAYKAGKKVGSR